ncbi:hypothetical protein [Tropicibacter naphthalenivorans]|uniref:Uncharacterized protein n=1 Tax=Tropicibacter naphthalenivorans TaxID=441103 RepID=A0A0P1G3I7_9RHOB|nr:hypothetical protein [Tropicibacter naphthalenivorans]CUH76268.1 hypothetical protein TRN7648_00863 [Tropicibacter naphthalenivorans]SMC39085.1 hypothetical protein SAMN04488093_10119 [Tropicibacter naphthalenivorans]
MHNLSRHDPISDRHEALSEEALGLEALICQTLARTLHRITTQAQTLLESILEECMGDDSGLDIAALRSILAVLKATA